MVLAIHQHESAVGMHVSPPSWTPCHLPPHPIPPGCRRPPTVGAWCHTSNPHWLSLYVRRCVGFSPVLSSHSTLFFSHWVQSLLFTSASPFCTCFLLVSFFRIWHDPQGWDPWRIKTVVCSLVCCARKKPSVSVIFCISLLLLLKQINAVWLV